MMLFRHKKEEPELVIRSDKIVKILIYVTIRNVDIFSFVVRLFSSFMFSFSAIKALIDFLSDTVS